MLLPIEILSDIAANLSVVDLGHLQQTHITIRDLVANDFAGRTRVYVHRLRIFRVPSKRRYVFDSKKGVLADCQNDQEFVRRMKHCVVARVAFGPRYHADQELIEVLREVRLAWANGIVDAPRLFNNLNTFNAAFGGVLRCKSLFIKPFDALPFIAAHSVFTLDAVRHCHSLDTHNCRSIDPEVVSAWLHRRTDWNDGPKTLVLRQWMDADAAQLVYRLKATFFADREPHSYRVEMLGRLEGILENFEYNDHTKECLIVDATNRQHNKITVERKILE